MARKRKTIEVQFLLDYANKNLARTDEFANKNFKAGICSMINAVLHETGNYRGFTFLNEEDSERDTVGFFSRHYS